MNKFFFLLLLVLFLFSGCVNKKSYKSNTKVPKNVILLISDGTGLSQISAAYYYKNSEVNYSRFEHIGLITTHSSKEDITDSAASGTALQGSTLDPDMHGASWAALLAELPLEN